MPQARRLPPEVKEHRAMLVEQTNRRRQAAAHHLHSLNTEHASAGPDSGAGAAAEGVPGAPPPYLRWMKDPQLNIRSQLTDEETVVCRWTLNGNLKTEEGAAGVFQEITVSGISVTTVEDDRVTAHRDYWDEADFLRQIGR